MSDSFDTWDGPRSVPPTSGREAHTNPEEDPALLRSELAACRREIDRLTAERDRLRSELAACRREIERLRERCRELDDHLAGVGAVTSVRSSSAATVDGVDRLRSELAEARDALLRRDEPCCDDRRIYDGGAYFEPYCVNCGRPA